ncbi:MAG: MmgE/PrpD family protein [Deltaproteobacteria bacterium]|nr:MmgE/PrpD family protein [Deltaproteobacteria bacterium]
MAAQEQRTAKPPLVEQLAHRVLEVNPASISPEVALQAKLLILDSIGCALAAVEGHAYKHAERTFAALGGNPECSVIGSRRRMPVTHAVMLNGVLIRELDLNDVYVGPGQTGHPSDNIAVALTVGERQKSSGLDVLASIVAGYEVYCRIQDLTVSAGPWDHVTASALAAPVIAGRLLNLNPDQLANALALSALHGNTLAAVRAGQLSNAKAMANAFVASQATLCTLVAAQGMTGPLTVIEGRGGLNQALLLGADLSLLVAPLTGHFKISDVSIKAYPCIGTAQAMVAAVLEARRGIAEPVKEIKRIELRMADIPFVRGQIEDQDRRRPNSRETADHSFYYLAAVALLDGELTPAQFGYDRWLDPSVGTLMERLIITTDPSLNAYIPGSYPCVLHFETQNGQSRTVEVFHPKGHPKNRMSPAEVEAKFRGCTRSVLSEPQQKEIFSLVLNLETLSSVTELVSRLALGEA